MKTKVDAYQQKTDDLQKLTSFLVTMTSLYAVVLGLVSYYSARQYIDQAKDSADRVEKLETDFRQRYPMLTGFDERVKDFVRGLKRPCGGRAAG